MATFTRMRIIGLSFLRVAVLLALWLAVASLAVSLYFVAVTYRSMYSSVAAVPEAQVALLLGASISADGTPSVVLKERADKAIDLYRAGKVKKILVSGDNGTQQYDEVYPVGKYLRAVGIPESDIFLDYAGFDTFSSMYRAKTVFDAPSIIVVSQRFHLPRALYIAHRLGLVAYGIDAGGNEHYLDNFLREIPASVKALFDVYDGRLPKYLGAQYPVSGDGSDTWVGPKLQGNYFKI